MQRVWMIPVISCLVCLVGSAADAQTIYKYTDKDGAVVLTDRPPKGVKAEPVVSGRPAAPPAAEAVEKTGPAPTPGAMTAEEAIRQRDRQLDEVVRTVETRDAQREQERQRRLQEAERLEAQAREPMPATRENRQRQFELLQEAQKLRQAQ
ncbi:MAG TPA: DUF4124 domain-containing protein [Syntrophales bacterium]|nr:DUF4124 domain-containing protein [Syntrophobacterales bacterium]HNQ01944.1 DUF4124 domain-containing protein [Syntrophales bacterium]HQL90438.1 DUF4124 domain-containing protein [Syntrophales bacterium]